MTFTSLQTWSNLADMLVARAELLDDAAESEASVAAVYGEAMAAYGRACMLSSSEEGDDLPGLLNNWGVGLHSLGTHAKVWRHQVQLRKSLSLAGAHTAGQCFRENLIACPFKLPRGSGGLHPRMGISRIKLRRIDREGCF